MGRSHKPKSQSSRGHPYCTPPASATSLPASSATRNQPISAAHKPDPICVQWSLQSQGCKHLRPSRIRACSRLRGRSTMPSPLELDFFAGRDLDLGKLPTAAQREVYAASLEAYIDDLHKEVAKMNIRLPVSGWDVDLTEQELAGIKAEHTIGILYKENEKLEFQRNELQTDNENLRREHDEYATQ
ncbi:hypothetical protein NM688_g6735 [Phlebia brevispora]|uniref:Uncharacterized protein n=1 Tax=Phlebia brevispora TaxID=194682 RepID=A0ACC1SD50_9APHY|nr:hypothetical protein NM688_g6735 [Phlebia brevispora]